MTLPLDFSRSDEHVMLADTLRRFAAEANGFEARAERLAASPPQRMALWAELAELGAIGALLPEHVGGFGGSPWDMAVVQASLSPSLPVEPLLSTGGVCGRLLSAAPDALAAELIAATVAGEAALALAHVEGFDPFAPAELKAHGLEDGRFVLDGRKPAVRHADVATHFIVSARLGGDTALFLVQATDAALRLAPTRMIDATGAADLAFEALELPPAAKLSIADPNAAIEDALEWGLVGLTVESAALIAACNRATFEYMSVRQQFATPLAGFQALQHKAADMAIAGEEAAAMAHLAVAALEAEPSPTRSCAVLRASLACDAAGRAASHAAVQMFGGMGVSDELAVSHYARRLAAIRSQIGTMDARAARLSALEGNG